MIGKWLARYALVFRDAAGLPARLSGGTVDAYDEFLRECEPGALEGAMRAAGASARFFPRPEQIRAAYLTVLEQQASGPRPKCECGGSGFVQIGNTWARCRSCSPGTAEEKEIQ